VERTTEAAGEQLAAVPQAAERGEAEQTWAWHRDAEGKTGAYVAVEATGVPQQGPEGSKVESRMANVGVIDNPVPEDPARWASPAVGPKPSWQARSVASLARRGERGAALRQQGTAVGMERVERWIALSDGGSGLEDCVHTHFPRVEVVILDFYHAAEYLSDLAKAWAGADTQRATALGQQWCHQLKHEGGQAVVATLQGLDLRGRSATRCDGYQTTVRYFTKHLHRMDSPTSRAKGWQMGSGPVESACKRVVGQRLKGAGMRWGEAGAEALCRLRALFVSEPGPWDAFWSRN
jgi:hypothetical protein